MSQTKQSTRYQLLEAQNEWQEVRAGQQTEKKAKVPPTTQTTTRVEEDTVSHLASTDILEHSIGNKKWKEREREREREEKLY